MSKPLILISQLTRVYDVLPVLRQLDLTIMRGECVALLGANGSGKSTLLRLLSGSAKPTSGSIRVGGWELPREAAAVRAQMGMVSHKPLLYENLTARENLLFFARLYQLSAKQQAERIPSLLARVGLAKRAHDRVRGFSRGMQQRLSLARALLHQPDILLLDEPHTGLDQEGAAMLDALILELCQGGQTIVMATHELERAARLASRAVLLARGQIVHDTPMEGMSGSELIMRYNEKTARRANG
jgi:heme exporter protein A